MTNSELRRKILKMVYERFREHPYYRITPKEFRENLNINLRELHYNIIYLEEKGLIELQKPLEGSIFVGARITPKGIELVEDEYQLNIIFPADQKEKSMPTNISVEFNQIIDAVESTDNMSSDLKEIIVEEIKEIQNELKKNAPSYSTVKKFVGKIKEKNYEIYEKIMALIRDPTITRILSESAKRELENM